jgi:hypothetical protein
LSDLASIGRPLDPVPITTVGAMRRPPASAVIAIRLDRDQSGT